VQLPTDFIVTQYLVVIHVILIAKRKNLNMKILKIFTIVTTFAFTASFGVQAQDLFVRESKPDMQLRSSNAAEIIKQYEKKEEISLANNVYGDNWSNAGVNIYKNMPKPEKLIIDLSDFSMPIKSRLVTSNYGYRARFKRNHYGIDVKGYTGDTIYAAFSGKVRVRKYDANGFGNYVVIRHSNGLETVYGHLSKQLVSENQEVKSGQPIGLCGNTGRSFGSHLHFETRVLGEAINPAFMFDFPNQDVKSDTYTYRSNSDKTMPVATPINSYADAPKPDPNHKPTNLAATTYTSTEEDVKIEPLAPAEKEEEMPANEDKAVKKSSKKANSKDTKKSASKAKSYTVKSGDSLYKIAKKNGTTVSELCKKNKIKENSTLKPGQSLKV